VITRDAVAGLACLAGSLVLLFMTRGLPQSALVPIGPGVYPRVLLVVMAALSAMLTLSGLRARRPAAAPVRYRLVLLTFAIFTAYVAALPWLGYRLATFLFVGVLQAVLEPPQGRRWLFVAIVAVLTAVATYYAFEVYLSVLLPRGRLTGF
jgi:putative tricarboxylic transport membrane protein